MTKIIDFFSSSKKEPDRVRITTFIHKYTNSLKHRPKRHRQSFTNLSKKLSKYEDRHNIELFTDSFTDTVTSDFLHFIKEEYNHRANTVRTIYQKLAVVLHSAERSGLKVDSGYSIVAPKEEPVPAIYLTLEELDKIYNVKLKRDADIVRDIFLIGCFTALRYSDYSTLTSNNIVDESISIKTKKTGAVVKIPMHRYVRSIFTKYNNALPQMHSQQNFNKVIKTVCKRAGINSQVRIERTVGLKIERKNYPKWQLVSSHTARRSGATNMYLAQIPTFRIMLLTGHATEQAFFRYIRISQEENVRILKDHEFFK